MPAHRSCVALTALFFLAPALAPAPASAVPAFRCTAAVAVNDLGLFGTPGLALLDSDLTYPAAVAELRGSGADAACEPGPRVLEAGALSTYFDDDQGSVSIRFEGSNGVAGVQFAVAICRFDSGEELETADFSVTVDAAEFPDGSSVGSLNVAVEDVTCVEGGPTTTSSTTSTTSSTSTTTLPGPRGCADLDGSGTVTASDCLGILRVAVAIETCAPECLCDPNGNGSTTASDTLLCLQAATGQDVDLLCGCE